MAEKDDSTAGAVPATQVRDAQGNAVRLTDDEQARYEKLKGSGKYTDEDTMRLRAMIESRGADAVRRMAWDLRARRDEELARRLAADDGKARDWQQYLVPTSPELLAAVSQKGPTDAQGYPLFQTEETADFWGPDPLARVTKLVPTGVPEYTKSGKEWLLRQMREEQSGSDAVDWGMRARHRYLAKRFGFAFKDEMRPVAGNVTVPLVTDREGWFQSGTPYMKVRQVVSREKTANGVFPRRWRRDIQLKDTRLPDNWETDPRVADDLDKYANAIIDWDRRGGTRYANMDPGREYVVKSKPYSTVGHALVQSRLAPTGRYEVSMPEEPRKPTAGAGRNRHKKPDTRRLERINRAREILLRERGKATQGALAGGTTRWSSGPRTTGVGTTVIGNGRYYAAYPGSNGQSGTSTAHSQAQANWLAKTAPYKGNVPTGTSVGDAWGITGNYDYRSSVQRSGDRAPDPSYAAKLDRWYEGRTAARDNPFRLSSLNVRDWTGTRVSPGSFTLDGMDRSTRIGRRATSGQDLWSPFGRYS